MLKRKLAVGFGVLIVAVLLLLFREELADLSGGGAAGSESGSALEGRFSAMIREQQVRDSVRSLEKRMTMQDLEKAGYRISADRIGRYSAEGNVVIRSQWIDHKMPSDLHFLRGMEVVCDELVISSDGESMILVGEVSLVDDGKGSARRATIDAVGARRVVLSMDGKSLHTERSWEIGGVELSSISGRTGTPRLP